MDQEKKYIPALTMALVVAVLPHTLEMPAWATAWCALMWGYLLFSLRFGWPKPGRKLLSLLSLGGVAGLVLTYGIRFDSEAFVGLLAVMAALKPFESRTHRDRMITVFIAYFIIISSLLKSETFSITLYMFFSVLVTTGAMVHINDPFGRYGASIRRAGIIMVQAAPLMILIFLLFPRIEGSLLGLRQNSRAETGFSDRLRPGTVASLAENNEVAFRAEFKGPVVQMEKRYWRGVVFQQFNGHSWDRQDMVPEIKQAVAGKEQVAYTLSLQPHNQRWIFALDIPAKAPSSRSSLYQDFTIRSQRPVTRKRRYEMLSNTGDNSAVNYWGVEQAGILPQKSNPRAQKLAEKLLRDSAGPHEIVSRVLDYFRDNDFIYTLNPPLLGRSAVDDFLFESKKGYCEHYASAFAFLMRAAGVPARVVGGYLGGELNPWGRYLIVRQSDAHAWVEVWYPKHGWTRVDPTLSVAPGRIEHGAGAWLQTGKLSEGFAGKYLSPLVTFIDQARLGWDAVSLRWETWFSGYSREQQQALLKALGLRIKSGTGFFLAFATAISLAAAIIFFYARTMRQKPPSSQDPTGRYYEKFCKKMAKAGVVRPVYMGPKDFAGFAAGLRPDIGKQIHAIADLYIRLRFDRDTSKDTQKQFMAGVRAFKPDAAVSGKKHKI